MRARHSIHRVIILFVTAAMLASCAYAPRVAEENDETLSIRNHYINSHPDGPYNEYILRGEVVKGMKYLEVLASWGYPVSRLRVPSRKLEYWRYVAHDDVSRDWVQYTFVFEGDELIEWEMARHSSKGRAMASIDFDDPTDLPNSETVRETESRAAVKH